MELFHNDNFEILKKKNLFFFLKPTLIIYYRLSKDGSRPLLEVSDMKEQQMIYILVEKNMRKHPTIVLKHPRMTLL